ncbi:MAG: hypothetical protein VKJ46_04980 [Leptolyngbyaceae bacterium]|nr:hypothetical protein [Leptolyngbyaceae bacterium]
MAQLYASAIKQNRAIAAFQHSCDRFFVTHRKAIAAIHRRIVLEK